MKIEKKEDIANFIESHLKELGGEAYGVIYIAEKLFEWHESELKNLRLGVVSNSLSLTEREDYLKGWEDGIEYANNTKNNDC